MSACKWKTFGSDRILQAEEGALGIYVYSELGSGTTFKIYFLEAKGTALEMDASQEVEMLEGNETIMVVDDEPTSRTMVVNDILQPLDYIVPEADCGETAVLLCQDTEENVNLLLTEVIMPGMFCKVLAATMKQVQPGIKELYMSGYIANFIARQGVLEPYH